MRIAPIVALLKAGDSHFSGNIAGTADLAALVLKEGAYPVPSCFVAQIAETATENTDDNETNQIVTTTFGVLVCLDNRQVTAEKIGLTAHEQLDPVWGEVWASIGGVILSGMESPISLSGGRQYDFDDARLWYLWEFQVDHRITQPVRVVSDDDLEKIYGEYQLTTAIDGDTENQEDIVELEAP